MSRRQVLKKNEDGVLSIHDIGPSLKKEFFMSLVHKGFGEAATSIGMDKIYTSPSSLRAKAFQLYQFILRDKEAYGITNEVAEIVAQAIKTRKFKPSQEIDAINNADLIDPEDTKSVILGGRNKAAMLLHKKMDRLSRNKKLLDATTLTQLATTFGIFFDKAQILQGQATENIAVLARIKENMSPEESLDALLTMREKVTQNE